MTLLITVFFAVISTLVWYVSEKARRLKVGVLLYMFWGASLMWLVDGLFEYSEVGAEFFKPSAQEMLSDTLLGFSAAALAMVVWAAVILVKDPMHTIKSVLGKK